MGTVSVDNEGHDSVPTMDNSALFVSELLTGQVILKDTSAWKRDLCSLRRNKESLIVYYVSDGSVAKEILLFISVQLPGPRGVS